mgnify:CR=1 FL=1
MANVSSSNGLEKRPKLRFPGFDEPWKATAFGDLVHEFSNRTKVEDEDVLLSAAIEGMFLNTELFGHQRGASNKGYKKIKYGTMVLSTQNLHLGNANVNQRFEHGMVSPAYKTYDISGCSIDLIAQWIKSDAAKRFFYNATTVGASVCRRNVEWDTLYEQSLFLPSLPEQEKIANLLTLLSNRIEKQRQVIIALKKYKRGLSNSLFDRLSVGSESRLYIFGDMMTILQNNTFSRDNLSVGDNGVRNIHYGDVLIKYGAVLDLHSENVPVINAEQDISKFSALSYLRNGDVVFADTAEDYTVGKSTEIIGAENIAALSGLHTIPCRPQDSFAPMYLGYYFNSDYFKKQLYPMIQGTKVSSISKSEIIKTKIIVPCLQEQARIASIMSALDDRIDAAMHTTKDLIDLRSGLLQQLFI